LTKLTAWYILIIMCISLAFSLALYQLITNQTYASLSQQAQIFRERRFGPFVNFDPMDEELLRAQVGEIQNRVRGTLTLVNIGVLIVGGTASYLLARRTLRPIAESLVAQRRFTADSSHELRTPLTAMRTEIEVALRDAKASREDYARIMRSNLEEVQRLERLSTGLLQLARYEEQGAPPPSTPTPLKSVADEALKKVEALAQQKRIPISHEQVTGTVLGDHARLVELLVILLDNAIKYSTGNAAVVLASHESGRHVTLTVRDNGIGIKGSDLLHVFDRFYRANSSRSKHKVDGYGLGLPIAKQIVEQHHGSISIDSEPGEGTTVTVTLPRYRA
ncbi:MAG: HAMP domain-containing sensor histidine kinase, partial [Patescibacteria group bacterium]